MLILDKTTHFLTGAGHYSPRGLSVQYSENYGMTMVFCMDVKLFEVRLYLHFKLIQFVFCAYRPTGFTVKICFTVTFLY